MTHFNQDFANYAKERTKTRITFGPFQNSRLTKLTTNNLKNLINNPHFNSNNKFEIVQKELEFRQIINSLELKIKL